jgi:hypothetical protein
MFDYYQGKNEIPSYLRRQECRDAWRKGWFFARELERQVEMTVKPKEPKS